jgi:hypothetical protein
MTALQFLIGFYTYGTDKYHDSLEIKENPALSEKISPRKLELSNIIFENKEFYREILDMSSTAITLLLFNFNENAAVAILSFMGYKFIQILVKYDIFFISPYPYAVVATFGATLWQNHILPFLPFVFLLELSDKYIDYKRKYGVLKPIIVASFWVAAVFFLPCVIHDGDYSVLSHPESYIPPLLTVFASSNLADIKDIDEDAFGGVRTIPVVFGKYVAGGVSAVSLITACYIHFYGFNIQPLNELIQTSPEIFVVKSISSLLPYVDTVGHDILHANDVFVSSVIQMNIPYEVKSFIIVSSIKLARLGDNIGSFMLQQYLHIVQYCFYK